MLSAQLLLLLVVFDLVYDLSSESLQLSRMESLYCALHRIADSVLRQNYLIEMKINENLNNINWSVVLFGMKKLACNKYREGRVDTLKFQNTTGSSTGSGCL